MTLVSSTLDFTAKFENKIRKGTWGARAPNERGVGKIDNF